MKKCLMIGLVTAGMVWASCPTSYTCLTHGMLATSGTVHVNGSRKYVTFTHSYSVYNSATKLTETRQHTFEVNCDTQ